MTQVHVAKLTVDSVDDIRQINGTSDTVCVPLGDGIPKGALLHTAIDDVQLTSGEMSADIRTRGGVEASRISLDMILDDHSSLFSFRSGREVLPGEVYTLCRGDIIDYRLTGKVQFAVLSVTAEFLRRHGAVDVERENVGFWEQRRWFRAPAPLRATICSSVRKTVARMSELDSALDGPALQQLQSELVEPFLWGVMFDERRSRERSTLSGSMIVRKVEDWMDGQSPGTVQIADLCRSLHLSRRTLQRAFTETLGVGPARYLTLKRLTAVRSELRAADPESMSVTEAATKYGFWELGRFAKDYRRMFGERPSETLGREISESAESSW